MEQTGNVWLLVASPDLKGCTPLTGARLAVNSAGSMSKALLDAYLALNCPEAKPDILFLPGSDNRAAALESGEIAGAMLELSDMMELDRRAPERFSRRVSYAEAFPKLKTTGIHVNRAFAESHAESLRAYLRAVLTAHRQMKTDRAPLEAALVRYLAVDRERAATIAAAYLDRKLWDDNGGLAIDDVQYSVDFFTRTGSLPAGLNAAGVADLSHLEAVLTELGRR